MSRIKPWTVILVALAVGGFVWALTERSFRKTTEDKLKESQQDYLKLLAKYLEKQKEIPQEIKQQIYHLREQFVGIEDAIAIELKKIIELIEDNKEEIAIEKLTKVIENIFKEKFVNEGIAKDRKSCPVLKNMLDKALSLNWITKYEYNFSCFLKDERNDEAHELAISFPNNWKFISFLAGIEILYNLKGIKRVNLQ